MKFCLQGDAIFSSMNEKKRETTTTKKQKKTEKQSDLFSPDLGKHRLCFLLTNF